MNVPGIFPEHQYIHTVFYNIMECSGNIPGLSVKLEIFLYIHISPGNIPGIFPSY